MPALRILLVMAMSESLLGMGQNLIRNSSFEDFAWPWGCPNSLSDFVPNCKDWGQPTNTTSDLYNTCATGTDVARAGLAIGKSDSQ